MKRYPGIKELAKLTKRSRTAVGHGAFLQISERGTRAWIFRYVSGGKAHHIGLGSCTYVTLAEARQKAFEYRRLLAAGVDPLQHKQQARRSLTAAAAKTFNQCAVEYIAAHEDGWRGGTSRKQWLATLKTYAFPHIGDMAIADVDVAAVLAVLDPIAREIPETANRVKHRIALILDWAAARDLRPQENPARRPKLLPKRKNGKKHFAALPYADIGAFMVRLRAHPELAAKALELLILTATRSGEVRGARWNEINGDTWTIPAERMKAYKPHRVPLCGRAIELLASLPQVGEYVFPAARTTRAAMDDHALRRLLARMGHGDITVHGFRSAFRDWAAETTAYANFVVEMALAHAVPGGAEEAYRRGDLFEKRSRLMQDWSDYCSRPHVAGDVVPLRKEVLA
jgi:integrase